MPEAVTPGIPENVSEKPRRKRGRPGIKDIAPAVWANARYAAPDGAKSVRSISNQVYIQNAIAVLHIGYHAQDGGENRRVYGWLLGVDGADPDWFQRLNLRRTILTELGRIDDEDDMRQIALEVCATRPRARDAVALIRRWRLGTDGRGSVAGLRGELIRHANDYLRRYPGMVWADVAEAVRDLLEAVEAAADGSPADG